MQSSNFSVGIEPVELSEKLFYSEADELQRFVNRIENMINIFS